MATSNLRQSSERVNRSKHKLAYKLVVHISNLHLYAPPCMRRLTKDKTGEVIIAASS